MINLMDRTFRQNPFPIYQQLRESQPVSPIQIGPVRGVLISRYDDAVAVLKNDAVFIKNPRRGMDPNKYREIERWIPAVFKPLQENMLDLDDPDHKRLRDLVHKAFTPRIITRMADRIETIGNQLLDQLQHRPSFDLIHDYALPLPLMVIAEILGVPIEDRGKFHRWTRSILKSPTPLNLMLSAPAIGEFSRYTRAQLALRRQTPKDDLLTALVQAQEAEDRLSEDEQLAMVLLLLIAGHETTVNLIANGMLSLMQNWEQMGWLRVNLDQLGTAVEELLRYHGPLETATERYTLESAEVAGVPIPKGTLVIVGLLSANRDETAFAEADQLNLQRPKNRHIAFGQGIHYCLGAPLARLEGSIALRLLLERFPRLHLAHSQDALQWRRVQIIRGVEKMMVKTGMN